MIEWDEKQQCYIIGTDELDLRLAPLGTHQGIQSLIHRAEGKEWVATNTKPIPAYDLAAGGSLFLLNLYHYLARNLPAGVIGRKLQGEHRVTERGVEVTLYPQQGCRIETKAVYSVSGPASVDLEVTVRAQEPYQGFELWLSSYALRRRYGAWFNVYSGPGGDESARAWVRPELNDLVRGYYLCYPRDNRAAALTYDGRWGSDMYQTFITGPYYAAPISVIRCPETGHAYIEMGQVASCCKVASSYVAADIDPATTSDDTRIYTVLFGSDLEVGKPVTARVRAAVVKTGEDLDRALRFYEEFDSLR